MALFTFFSSANGMKIPFSLMVMWHCHTVTAKVCEGILCCIPSSSPFSPFACEGNVLCSCVYMCGRSSARGDPDFPETFFSGFWQCLFSNVFSSQHSKAVLQCFHQMQDKHMMDIKMSEPPLPLKGMPYLTAEVLSSSPSYLLPRGHQRPVLAHPKGSTVAIR